MSSAAGCAQRMRRAPRETVFRFATAREATVRRRLRRCATGATVTVLVYAALLVWPAGNEGLFEASWVRFGAEHLRTPAAAAAERLAAFGQDTARTLTPLYAVALWPLGALALLWLARRHPVVYVRGAFAVLLSGAAGLTVLAVEQGLPGHETSLVHDYLALPGVRAGWYVLMALAVLTTATRAWIRAAALVIALVVDAATVTTVHQHLLGGLLAAAVPLIAWYTAGRLRLRTRLQRADPQP
ncbi:hypothetical protein ACFYO2_36740 [Streptomyces sp. NPDC006602]|uniref:hypothetical protein n=1 Tax=Streptomyces sp. NPDC006602 TaxID=3364751 RepID=UPI003699137D